MATHATRNGAYIDTGRVHKVDPERKRSDKLGQANAHAQTLPAKG